MTVHLKIKADIIDIRTDEPQNTDVLFVDTNVWLWQTYGIPPDPKLGHGKRAYGKSLVYTAYLKHAIANGAQLKYSGLILAELTHVIEKTEFNIFKQRKRLHSLKAKVYRHNYPEERKAIAATVKLAWSQVAMMASSADLTVDEALANVALQRLQTQALDGYDLFLLEAIDRAVVNPVQVLTDDMDYACVPGIQVYTNNVLVLTQAASQGQLLDRRLSSH